MIRTSLAGRLLRPQNVAAIAWQVTVSMNTHHAGVIVLSDDEGKETTTPPEGVVESVIDERDWSHLDCDAILEFLEDVSIAELQMVSGWSQKRATTLMELQPFGSWSALVRFFFSSSTDRRTFLILLLSLKRGLTNGKSRTWSEVLGKKLRFTVKTFRRQELTMPLMAKRLHRKKVLFLLIFYIRCHTTEPLLSTVVAMEITLVCYKQHSSTVNKQNLTRVHPFPSCFVQEMLVHWFALFSVSYVHAPGLSRHEFSTAIYFPPLAMKSKRAKEVAFAKILCVDSFFFFFFEV